MVGGRLSFLFTYVVGLLLGVSLHDMEASGERQVINKKVGDSVEFSVDLPTEGVSSVTWRYKNSIVAIRRSGVTANNPFQDRVEFNNMNLSLTVRKLILDDSGDFSFTSDTKGQQRPSVFFTLQVHEPISEKPSLISNISELGSNGFCSVSLECRAASHSNVTYIWTVRNRTYGGPRLQHNISPQDGDTSFNCTVFNVVSQMTTLKSIRCSNSTGIPKNRVSGSSLIIFWVRMVLGVAVILVLIWLLYYTNSKELFCARFKQTVTVDQDLSQQHPHSSPPPGEPLDEYCPPQQVPFKDQDDVNENE